MLHCYLAIQGGQASRLLMQLVGGELMRLAGACPYRNHGLQAIPACLGLMCYWVHCQTFTCTHAIIPQSPSSPNAGATAQSSHTMCLPTAGQPLDCTPCCRALKSFFFLRSHIMRSSVSIRLFLQGTTSGMLFTLPTIRGDRYRRAWNSLWWGSLVV